MPTVVTTKCYFVFPVTALAILIAIAFASPVLANLTISAKSCISTNFSAGKTSSGAFDSTCALSIPNFWHHQLLDDHSQEYWYQYP